MAPGTSDRRDWGESASLFVCVALFAGLKNRYTLGPPLLTTVFGGLVAAVFFLSVFSTAIGNRRGARGATAASAIVLAIAVALSLVKTVYLVIYEASSIDGTRLIETALLIWVGNVIVFAILYRLIGEKEFAFPRPDPQRLDESFNFLDYLFLAFTTATAFSPTDTPPLSTRARMFMMVEAIISLLVIAIAAARAINILPQSSGT
jgi:hypothetical protein